MAANTNAIYALTPNIGAVQYGTAEAGTRSGTPTNVATVFTAGANGSRIDLITLTAGVSTSAGIWRLWLFSGSTYYLIKEILVSAITVSATAAAFSAEYRPTIPIVLPTGWSLRFTTEVGNTTAVVCYGADF
jgi:hypothetical protein